MTPARAQGIATQQPRARSFRLYRSLRHQSAKAVLVIYCSELYCALLRDAYLLRPLVLRTEALNTSIQWHPLFRPPARPRPSYLQKSKRRSRTLYTSVVRLVQLFFDARCEATGWKLIRAGIAASLAGAVSLITCVYTAECQPGRVPRGRTVQGRKEADYPRSHIPSVSYLAACSSLNSTRLSS